MPIDKQKRVSRYPDGVVVRPSKAVLTKLKSKYGGKVPSFRSPKYPTDEEGWTKFYADALTYWNKDKYCRENGYTPPVCAKKYRYEYVLFHGTQKEKSDRMARNRDRKMHGLKTGDKRVVHHHDQKTMDPRKTVKLTHCQHQRIHGKRCRKEKV